MNTGFVTIVSLDYTHISGFVNAFLGIFTYFIYVYIRGSFSTLDPLSINSYVFVVLTTVDYVSALLVAGTDCFCSSLKTIRCLGVVLGAPAIVTIEFPIARFSGNISLLCA